jgi:predicted O-methyltransferase YrrM
MGAGLDRRPLSVPMDRPVAAARERARVSAADAEGWLSEAQGEALFDAARHSRGHVVEIGSWQGRSTIWLAAGARLAGRRVFAIDPHEGSREDPSARTFNSFARNLDAAGLSDVVTPLVMRSTEAVSNVDGPVGLLFIDGDHSIEGARLDSETWLPRVAPSGVVMFHDVATSGYSGPRRIFQRMVCWNPGFHRLRKVGSMGIAERTAGRRPLAAVRGRIFGTLLFWYDIQGAVKRVLRSVRRFVRRGPGMVTAGL